jgi:hypothetical protein
MTCERVLAGQGLGVRSRVLVVREDQVAAATLHVEAEPEPVQRDHRALDMPAGTPAADLRVPVRFAIAVPPPQQ